MNGLRHGSWVTHRWRPWLQHHGQRLLRALRLTDLQTQAFTCRTPPGYKGWCVKGCWVLKCESVLESRNVKEIYFIKYLKKCRSSLRRLHFSSPVNEGFCRVFLDVGDSNEMLRWNGQTSQNRQQVYVTYSFQPCLLFWFFSPCKWNKYNWVPSSFFLELEGVKRGRTHIMQVFCYLDAQKKYLYFFFGTFLTIVLF